LGAEKFNTEDHVERNQRNDGDATVRYKIDNDDDYEKKVFI